MDLPADISVSQARLPQAYEAAKTALANCAALDECQQWADKAEALASYAKQADDDTLRQMADRIQARAVRRAGELLKQFDARQGQNLPTAKKAGALPISQQAMARDAGMSDHQRKQAVRVANVPAEQFEKQVESEAPPTVTALAKQGMKPRDIERATAPKNFARATQILGTLDDFAAFCARTDPETAGEGMNPREIARMRERVASIDAWLDRFVVNLGD